MRIVNAMFGRGKGGIEQAALDYSTALTEQGNEVLTLLHPGAAIFPSFADRHITPVTVKNYGQWDPLAVLQLKKLLREFRPDIIITHGNRATVLLKKAAAGKIPIAGVCHNYRLKYLLKCDLLLSITDHMRETVIAEGYAAEKVFTIPNMIRWRECQSHPTWRNPPVIGAMGRFVAKKGFDVLIRALAYLKAEGVPFHAMLGGSGEEEARLKQQVAHAKLTKEVTFSGWVEDKEAFYQSCDIFCLPSLHEPFGIVLLEALMQKLPIVTTNSEGPQEIVTHGKDAWVVPVGNARALSLGLKQFLLAPAFATGLARKGQKMAYSRYSMEVVGSRLQSVLEESCQK